MPLFQYLAGWEAFLLAALLAANWCFPAPISPAPLLMFRSIRNHIRIHTDHKWTERVVLDTTRSTLAREGKADARD